MTATPSAPGVASPAGEPLRVLVVDDDPSQAEAVIRALSRAGFAPESQRVDGEPAFVESLAVLPDVVLSELSLQTFGAARALELLHQRGRDIPLIVVSGAVGEEVVVGLMRRGAADYVCKDRLSRLGPAVRRALEERRLRARERQAERVLRQTQAEYRHLADDVPVGLCRTTPAGEFLDANPAFLELVGYPSLDALRSTTTSALYPDAADRERRSALLERDGVITDLEAQLRRGDGALIWVRVNARAVSHPLDRTVQYEEVLIDITKRKRAEDEIARRASQLETFADVGRRLREADHVDQMYSIVVERAMHLLHAEHGSLNLMDPERQQLTCVHVAGVMQEPVGVKFPVAGSPSGNVIATERPYVTDAVGNEPQLPWLRSAYYDVLGPVAIVPMRSERAVVGTLCVARAKDSDGPFTDAELRLLDGVAEIGGTAIRRAQLHDNLEQAYMQMVLALARTVDARDSYTGAHSEHLAIWAELVARELGCGEDEIRAIRWGALLHDIGKIGVPDEILRKPGPLTDEEWNVMRKHSTIGEEILRPVDRMSPVAALVRHHQERWDGTGYPDGLRGDAIPLGARIVAVADAYSAMMDDRAYRKGRTKEGALEDLRGSAGTQFDARVVEVFCRIVQDDVPLGASPPGSAKRGEDAPVRPTVQAIARSLTQARQAGRAMPAMADVAKRLLRPLDLPAVLDEILSQIQDVFAYSTCRILLLDEQTHELRVEAHRGDDPAPAEPSTLQIAAEGIAGWIARHGRSYYAADVSRDPLYVSGAHEAGSEVGYPLTGDGRVIGVLTVASPAVDAFPHDVREPLETFATLAALAILRAKRDDDLNRLALTDGLTGLANHRALWETLERETAQAERHNHPMSVVMVEVDRFKLTNDHFGHLHGDAILRAVADVLKKNSRAGDLAARFGGDEFVLLLPGASKAAAVQIAERIRRHVQEIPGPGGVRLTVSIGLASMPEDGRNAGALVEASDRAMYEAKYIGGNRVNIA